MSDFDNLIESIYKSLITENPRQAAQPQTPTPQTDNAMMHLQRLAQQGDPKARAQLVTLVKKKQNVVQQAVSKGNLELMKHQQAISRSA